MQLYPRWKVTLLLRLEEFGANGELLRYARSQPPINDTKSGENAPLKAVQDQDASQRGVRRWIITRPNSAATTPNLQGPVATKNVPAVPKPTNAPVKQPSAPAAAANTASVAQLGDLYRQGTLSPTQYYNSLVNNHYDNGEAFQTDLGKALKGQ